MLVVWAAVLAIAAPADAAVFNVPSGDVAALKAAIIAANFAAGPHTIILEAGTYTLTVKNHTAARKGDTALPAITRPTTIQGAGAEITIIERSAAAATPKFRIFENASNLTLNDVTVRNGNVGIGNGAAVFSSGPLTISDCVISDNTAARPGGAILSSAETTIERSTFTNNTVTDGFDGGAIQVDQSGTLAVSDSTFFNNRADAGAGAIQMFTGSITRSTFTDNVAWHGAVLALGGSIDFFHSATITDSYFARNRGGVGRSGGAVKAGVRTALTISGSTFEANVADHFGGALYSEAAINRITNSTFSGNSTQTFHGGAIAMHSNGQWDLRNVTITGNRAQMHGGGIYLNGAVVRIQNSILGGNTTAAGSPSNCADFATSGAVVFPTSQGYNLESANTCGFVPAPSGTDLVGTDPQLGPLQENGGPTKTHALLAESPAIDGGNPNGCSDALGALLKSDQRGGPRADGAGCDIGAYEALTTRSADVSIVKSAASNPVIAGDDLTYTVVVTNSGPDTATGVKVSDALPAGIGNVAIATTLGVCTGSGTITCNLGTMPSGTEATVTIVVTPTAAGTITNTASVLANEPDPDPSNNSSTAASEVRVPADLAIVSMTDSPDPVIVGNDLTYTIVVTNDGPGSATLATVTVTLPSNVTAGSASATQGTCSPSSCKLGTLPADSTATMTMVVRPTVAGAFNATASVSADEPDSDTTNNTKSTTTTVTAAADLAVATSATPSPATVGKVLTYTVTVTNNGPSPATSVRLTDNLAASLTFLGSAGASCTRTGGGAGDTLTCELGTLAAGASTAVMITVAPTAAGTVVNTATVTGSELDSTMANNTATVSTTVNPGTADLSITVADAPDPLFMGSLLTYTITVTNGGHLVATGVVVSDVLPAGVTFNPTSSSSICSFDGGTVRCTLGSVDIGSTVGVVIAVTPTLPGALTNIVTAAGNQPDPTPATATTVTTVNATTVSIAIAESITVSDTPGLLPSAMIAIVESITVSDTPALLGAAMIAITESITVSDGFFDTAEGIDVAVQLLDGTTGTTPVTVTFAEVTEAGLTRLTTSTSGPATPTGFTLGSPATYFNLTTTAVFSGPATVCIDYSGIAFSDESSLRLFHYENGAWLDQTVSHDPATNTICASVTSFSPFAIVEPDLPGRMHGQGHVDAGGVRHVFEFRARDRGEGQEGGRLHYQVHGSKPAPTPKRGRGDDRDDDRDGRRGPVDRFASSAVSSVSFFDTPGSRPGRGHRAPTADTVIFSGTGRWNGTPGYFFEVRAVDAGEPGRQRDEVTITIMSPSGVVVSSVTGALSGGNIQSRRVP